MTWLYLIDCQRAYERVAKPVYAVPEHKTGFEEGWRAACRFLQDAAPQVPQAARPGGRPETTTPAAAAPVALGGQHSIASSEAPPSLNEARAIGLLRVVRDEWYRHTPYSELKASIDGLLDSCQYVDESAKT